MENASKALIMAGSILIGIIIISIGVYLFASFGGTSKNIQEQIDSRTLAEFNNNFEKYRGSNECTIHDIVSLASFAKKNNQNFDKTSDYYVNVYINEVGLRNDLSSYTEDQYIDLLQHNIVSSTSSDTQYFTCYNIIYVKENSRVKSIFFRKYN